VASVMVVAPLVRGAPSVVEASLTERRIISHRHRDTGPYRAPGQNATDRFDKNKATRAGQRPLTGVASVGAKRLGAYR
jgi:hypothetical protein